MSSGPSGAAYRCDTCRTSTERCAPCRKRRSAARRAGYRAAVALGQCVDCGLDALPNETRCYEHKAANRARVAAHAARHG